MKLSETIKELLKLYDEHGDVEMYIKHSVHYSGSYDYEPFYNNLEEVSFEAKENKVILDAYIIFNQR